MKNASKLRLSLRKLLVATLAVGPLAVLPAPVWAAVPANNTNNATYTVTSGTASYTAVNAGAVANIVASDRAVLVWGAGKFNIGVGDTFSFILPSSSASVLNKVGYNADGTLAAVDTATISGELSSNGRVFLLANGGITVNAGSTINTAGLVLSTISEATDGAYTALGNLSYLGSSTGTITLNNVNIAGSVTATAGAYGAIGGSVSGDLVLNSVVSGTGLALAGANPLAVGGNLTVATTNGTVSQTNAITVGATPASAIGGVGAQTTSVSSGTGAITLNNVANNFQTISVSTGSNASIADGDLVRLGASTVGGNLDVSAVGLPANSTTALATTGALAVTGTGTFNTTGNVDGAAVSIANGSSIGGAIGGVITGNGSFNFNGTGPVNVGNINSNRGGTAGIGGTGGGNRTGVTIVTDNSVRVTGTVTAVSNNTGASGAISITGTSVAQEAGSSLTAGARTAGNADFNGGITLTATTGNITVGTLTASRAVTLNASAGNVTQLAGTAIVTTNTSAGNSTLSVRSAGDATIANADNVLATGWVTFNVTGGGNATLVTKTNAMNLISSNVTGALSLTSTGQNIVLGGTGLGTSGGSVVVNGNLTVNAGAGNIDDNNYGTFNVFGALNLTGSAITLDAAYKNGGVSPAVRLGQINAAAATSLEVGETTTVNLGTVTAPSLMVQSVTGGVVDTGVITATNAVFAVTGNNSVVLADNAITNTAIRGGVDHSASNTITSSFGSATIGATTYNTSSTGNVTVAATGATSDLTVTALSAGNLSASAGQNLAIGGAAAVTGNATLTAVGTTTQTAALTVAGVTTVNSTGAITLAGANDFSSIVLNAGAAATVNDINNLSLSGTVAGSLAATAGGAGATIAAPWNLSLGNLSVGTVAADTLTLTAANGGGGNSGTITQQSGTKVSSFSDISLVTNAANIVLNNAGNNFGRVSASTSGAAGGTGGSGSITIRESGTLKVGSIGANGTSTTLTSDTGSIIEDAAVNTVLTLTNGTLTLNATAGSVILDGSSRTAGTTTGSTQTFRVEAPNGAVKLLSGNANMTLSTINANSLTVTHTGGNNLTQSGRLNVYGGLSITSGANITLSNTTNNFGRISLSATGAGKNITLTEANTVNLGSITQANLATGNVTITSVNGDIIDTGLAGVKPGGGTAANIGSGVITLNATKGNITLDDPTTDFQTTGGVVVNANNVVLSPLGATTLVLGAATGTSTVAGNLTATSATGSIAQAGNVSVTGDAVFQTGNGNITLTQTGNNFGTIRFTGNVVRIAEASDMALVTGSSAIGNSEFTSGGNITITNRGGVVTFGTTALATPILTATGSITLPKLVQAAASIVLNAAGTKDLSALSLTADLAGKNPTNLGAGAYLPPSP